MIKNETSKKENELILIIGLCFVFGTIIKILKMLDLEDENSSDSQGNE